MSASISGMNIEVVAIQHNLGTNETSSSVSDTHTRTDQPVLQDSLERNSMATGNTNEEVTGSDSESEQSSNEEEEGEGQQGGRTTDQPSSQRNVIVSVSEPEFQTPRLPNLAQQALQRLANAQRTVEESPDDFQPLKKRRRQEVSQEEEEDEDEGQTCSICFEPWSNSGGHRIASLKCGHLFGHNCIEKWLKGQGAGKCPQCNAKAKRGDIRVIYSKTVSVVDTTDRDRALKELEAEKALRIGAQKAEAQAILQHQLARAECDRLREEIRQLRGQLEFYSKTPSGLSTGEQSDAPPLVDQPNQRYVLQREFTVSQIGGARVLAFDPMQGMLVASKPSNNQIMPGYGLMKLSTLELRYSEFVRVHSGVLRDVVFSPQGDGMVLTAAMDKTVKLTSMHSNTVVQTYQTPLPAWACAWNQDDYNYLYCGLQNGTVYVYDVRNTSGHVTELQRPGGGACPITSLAYVPLCRASTLNCSGILMGTLGSSTFWEKASFSESFTPHPLHTLPEGACTCLSFDQATRHCLASFRPSKRSPHSRHILCQLHNTPVDQPFSCQLVHQFTGGGTHKLLSRSKLFQRPGNDDRLLAAFGDEGTSSVQVWDVSTTSKLQQLSLGDGAALDMVPFASNDRDYLAVLTAAKLRVYHWQ